LAVANAIIIHTIRDPIDTCISCFSKLFAAEQNHDPSGSIRGLVTGWFAPHRVEYDC
jgi:hypothetical protein